MQIRLGTVSPNNSSRIYCIYCIRQYVGGFFLLTWKKKILSKNKYDFNLCPYGSFFKTLNVKMFY